MSSILPESEGGGKLVPVLHEGLYHPDYLIDSKSTNVEDYWLNFGEEDPAEKHAVVEALLIHAVKNGISERGLQELRTPTEEFGYVLRILLDPGPPAIIYPMKRELIYNARPFRAKQRRCPP